ncbi:hypothetical protein IV203_011414 [Nitzschia inconspicua]|uniref:Uncharacterized protein n=1 Tax=Nitzschia inconspicua TaxID=303405 RepID=A0A9K3KSP1_9STRA|nr:hypothetical protein IV203_011414 [Nitzschia inconspicua]
MNSAVENSAVENTGAEEDSESPLAKRAKTSSRDDTLPPELDGLTEKDYHRITSAEVVLDKDHSAHGFEKGERYSMAMSIASEDGDQPAIDITKLHLSKLRKLGKNFGIKMISKMPSAVIRIHLARNSHIGSILDNGTNLRPPAPPEKIKQNTIVRLVRTAMYGLDDGDEENIADVDDSHEQRSLDSLDTGDEDDNFGLQRDDLLLERTTGANDPYASLSRFEERTDLDHDKVKLYFETADLNPGKYMKMPSQTLHSWTKDLLRARKKLLENMKKSGEHDSDMYSFVRIALKGTNLVKTIGEFTLYYFCLTQQHQ